MHQGWIRQGCRCDPRYEIGPQYGCRQRRKPPQRIAHQHRLLCRCGLHHLLEKPADLPCPKAIVDRPPAVMAWLLRTAKANQIDAVNAVALSRERGSVETPMLATGAKSMQEHKRLAFRWPHYPPVAS